MSARPEPKVIDACFEEAGERRGRDRRTGERRAQRTRLHALFAATLVNHVAAAEEATPRTYPSGPSLRSGVVVNVRT